MEHHLWQFNSRNPDQQTSVAAAQSLVLVKFEIRETREAFPETAMAIVRRQQQA